jgi:hypothetical protein
VSIGMWYVRHVLTDCYKEERFRHKLIGTVGKPRQFQTGGEITSATVVRVTCTCVVRVCGVVRKIAPACSQAQTTILPLPFFREIKYYE